MVAFIFYLRFVKSIFRMVKSSSTQEKYDRIARFHDSFSSGSERRWFSKWKRQFFSPLKGNILEVGIGTGKSIEFYNNDAQVTGIDFSGKMLQKAKEKLVKSGKGNIVLKQGNVETLEFEDNTFDYVVTSCVFCSVPDPVKGLKEIKRVLKPTGKLIMLEHVLSKNPLVALLEHIHNPITKCIMGVNINRNTRQNILDSSMKISEDRNLAVFDVFRLFVATKGSKRDLAQRGT